MNTTPLIGQIDFTPVSQDPTPGEDGLVAEISASARLGKKFFTISSGGSNLVSIADWSNPSTPKIVGQLNLEGFFTTSVATFGNLVAIAATPDSYGSAGEKAKRSQIRFYEINNAGDLKFLAKVKSGYLTDGIRFSADGRQLYAANEGQPNADFSSDPAGSISLINIRGKGTQRTFTSSELSLPDLDKSSIELFGRGIRFSGLSGVTTSFSDDAEPEYLATAGKYLFATLQENNAIARINTRTLKVEAYIGAGWVDYSPLAIDLTDEDVDDGTASSDGFNPKTGQQTVGLRMPDGIAAWKNKNDIYLLTANEGDAREYTEGVTPGIYFDETRNKDLAVSYATSPGRLKLIAEGGEPYFGNPDDEIKTKALILNPTADGKPDNDFSFEDTNASPTRGTPVGFGSRSLSIIDGLTGELLWDSWMADSIKGVTYNTSLQNIAQFAGVYDDGRSDDKGVEPETVAIVNYQGRKYGVGALERTTAGDKICDGSSLDPVTKGGLLVVYDITNVKNVNFVTYQQVSRSPEGLEVIKKSQSPTGRILLGVSAEFDSNSVELLDFGSVLKNGNGAAYLASDLANPALYVTL